MASHQGGNSRREGRGWTGSYRELEGETTDDETTDGGHEPLAPGPGEKNC